MAAPSGAFFQARGALLAKGEGVMGIYVVIALLGAAWIIFR